MHAGARRSPAFVLLHETLLVIVLCGLVACKPTMTVGEYQCSEVGTDGGAGSTDPIAVPWETGFENGFCDYTRVGGFCYRFPPVTFRLVDAPVHSGRYAAEITVVTGTDGGSQPQGRCVRQSVLPVEAYYGAWFLIPRTATNRGLWNLFHFRTDSQPVGLWDVSLTSDSEHCTAGELCLELYSMRFSNRDDRYSPPVPIGRWFHVVLYLKRAKDASGAVALYLDEKNVVESTNLVTDDTDWGQWYVGNLASDVNPPECTVYLDDVTIRSTL